MKTVFKKFIEAHKATNHSRLKERGNVLFLILIAVALFAALSYAVTSSSRSGGGDANSETNLVNSAQVTQYPSSVRTSIIRMMISNNIQATQLAFNQPGSFDADATTHPRHVFHPSGGGAAPSVIPANIMAPGFGQGIWYFNANFEIANVGTSSGTSADGNDIIAFLPGISDPLCGRINEELGVTGDVTWDPTDARITDNMEATDSIPATEEIIGGADNAGLAGQAFGCMIDSSTTPNRSIYYHVLIER